MVRAKVGICFRHLVGQAYQEKFSYLSMASMTFLRF